MYKASILIITIALCIYLYYLSNSVPRETIMAFVNQFGVWGTVVFIGLNWITFLAPLSNTPLLLAGYYIYGPATVFYIAAAMALSMVTNFWIAKIWGNKLVSSLVGRDNMKKVDQFAEKYDSWNTLFLLRLSQGGMHKFVSYALGFTKMNFGTYLLVSVVALLPLVGLWYFLATSVQDPLQFLLATQVLGGIPVIFFTLIVFLKKKR